MDDLVNYPVISNTKFSEHSKITGQRVAEFEWFCGELFINCLDNPDGQFIILD